MRRHGLVIALGLLGAACGEKAPPPPDPAVVAQQRADSVLAAHTQGAAALLDEAKGVMKQVLKDSATATFDSLVVVQPPMANGTWPAPAVCGRIGGKPGVKGTTGMTPFIYMNRMTVFVLESSNATEFAGLRAKMCDGAGTKVLLK